MLRTARVYVSAEAHQNMVLGYLSETVNFQRRKSVLVSHKEKQGSNKNPSQNPSFRVRCSDLCKGPGSKRTSPERTQGDPGCPKHCRQCFCKIVLRHWVLVVPCLCQSSSGACSTIQQFRRVTSVGSLSPKTLRKFRRPPQNPAEPRRTLGETPAEPSERFPQSPPRGKFPRRASRVTLRNFRIRGVPAMFYRFCLEGWGARVQKLETTKREHKIHLALLRPGQTNKMEKLKGTDGAKLAVFDNFSQSATGCSYRSP